MKKNYDFSRGERGKFYRPFEQYNIVINYEASDKKASFEIFRGDGALYYFRLKAGEGSVLYVSGGYRTKDDCLKAVQEYQKMTVLASIVNI
jgi:uncharacterized protein YegP (UPF0339 family)